jgi:hypothetical protein
MMLDNSTYSWVSVNYNRKANDEECLLIQKELTIRFRWF